MVFPNCVHIGPCFKAVIENIRTAVAEQTALRKTEKGRYDPFNSL